MLRRVYLSAITVIMLLSAVFMPTTAFAYTENPNYTVDGVVYTAELRFDGSSVVTEQWTVTFGETGSSRFCRSLLMPEDNFEHISGIGDISVSVDGNNLAVDNGEKPKNGTYSVVTNESDYSVFWNIDAPGETHTFSLRYIESGKVKLYNGKAYFYCRVVNDDTKQICKNVTVTVKTPKTCFPEDFTIMESGSLAGEKSDGAVTFRSEYTVGLVKIGVSMPSELYDEQSLVRIVDNRTKEIVVGVLAALVAVGVPVAVILYCVNYRKYFRKRYEKLSRKNKNTVNRDTVNDIFNTVSPAEIMKMTLSSFENGADMFIVTALELVKRGYIKDGIDGFSGAYNSESDIFSRPLKAYEKEIIKFFRHNDTEDALDDPSAFRKLVSEFNDKIKIYSPFEELNKQKRDIICRAFDMKTAVDVYEMISPVEISDDFFGRSRFTVYDMLMSVMNEAVHGKIKVDEGKYKKNLFMLRYIYEKGADREE